MQVGLLYERLETMPGERLCEPIGQHVVGWHPFDCDLALLYFLSKPMALNVDVPQASVELVAMLVSDRMVCRLSE